MIQSPGYICVFEGPDGGGKTTMVKRVVAMLKSYGYDPLFYRGPGGTQFGESMRNAMFNKDLPFPPCNEAMTHAMMASHAQVTHEVLLPQKKLGKLILLDRYVESTYSYQGQTAQAEFRIEQMIDGLVPYRLIDCTYIIDAPIEVCRQRVADRGVENFLDTNPISFYEGVRERLMRRMFEMTRRGEKFIKIDNNVSMEQSQTIANDIAISIMAAYSHQ